MYLSDCTAPTKSKENRISFDIISTEFISEGNLYKTFGLLAESGKESLKIENISDEYVLIECLCRRLQEGKPPLYQLRDIVEDFVVDWPYIQDIELKKRRDYDMIGKKYSE